MRLVPASSRELASSCSCLRLNTPRSSTFEAAISSEIELHEQKSRNTNENFDDAKSPDSQTRDSEKIFISLDEISQETQVEYVDKLKLEEGYRLFGSLFSLMENEMLADTQKQEFSRHNNSADARVSTRFQNSFGTLPPEGATGVRKTGSVVLDFVKASSRMGAGVNGLQPAMKNNVSGFDITDSGNRIRAGEEVDDHFVNQNSMGDDATSVEEIADRSVLIDASVALSKFGECQVNHGVDTQSDVALPVFSSQRVEQIVRAVVEQTPQSANVSSAAFAVESRVSGQMLRLSLHPVELGAVGITIFRRGRRLEVKIVPELESTGKVLLSDAKELMDSLGLASIDGDLVRVSISTIGGQALSEHDGEMPNTFVNQHEHSPGGHGRSGRSRTQTVVRSEESISNDLPEPDIVDSPAIGVRHHGLYI